MTDKRYDKQLAKDAAALLDFWQRILRLQDWRITLTICKRGVLPDGVVGGVKPQMDSMTATIRVLHPIHHIDYQPGDLELTIVHELLHLHFWPLTKSENPAEERAIEMIADALLTMVAQVRKSEKTKKKRA